MPGGPRLRRARRRRVLASARQRRRVFDSDAATNRNVRREEDAIARELFQRGAKPYVVRLPHVTRAKGRSKTGLDDFYVARGKRAEREITDLCNAAESRWALRSRNAEEVLK